MSAILLTACSDDKPDTAAPEKPAAKTKPVNNNNVDAGEASDTVKQKFVKTFAKNCVTREMKNSVNKDIDEKRFTESCGCIAEHIVEDLAEVDAEKYLDDHEDTHTLQIKFDAAAFFCLQNKPQPKGPHLFGK
ncbi:hypothetical protein IVG45_16310 [Methylomonas sp. LL1]|uniref:hypothetical protein n=1 Tax=Methylomonas sp. LL1 TaxID=2785785 RepID=UPI0018C371D2|nr:hypothetical protein [Methylomonas sp. LL1]QPK62403.1 hypothetical protein IVG45_16310 [Methylomonas sp. LL1]